MRINKARLVLALCILVIVALIIPFESTVIPPASVRIVDEAGNSMPNVLVKQEWKDVVVEDEMHVDFVRTDENGVAVFPNRTVRSFLLKRLFNVVWRISTQGVHASIWPYGTLTAYANGDPDLWGWVGYTSNGGAWPDQIELRRWETPAYP